MNPYPLNTRVQADSGRRRCATFTPSSPITPGISGRCCIFRKARQHRTSNFRLRARLERRSSAGSTHALGDDPDAVDARAFRGVEHTDDRLVAQRRRAGNEDRLVAAAGVDRPQSRASRSPSVTGWWLMATLPSAAHRRRSGRAPGWRPAAASGRAAGFRSPAASAAARPGR